MALRPEMTDTTDDRLRARDEDRSSAPERERQMADLCISYDGRRYYYNGYRYDRWEDALAYARLMRLQPGRVDAGGHFQPGQKTFTGPTETERTLMASLSIRFEGGAYRFEGFSYDELSDAVSYAWHQRGR